MAHPIQMILTRQLAAHLDVPVFVVDPAGTMLFYNEPAEAILGCRFAETGVMPADTWSSIFHPIDDKGAGVAPEELPLMITLKTQRPAHKSFHIRGLNDVARHLEVTAIPIAGLQGEFLGAAALFWELK